MQTLCSNITPPITAIGLLRSRRRASVKLTASAKCDGGGDIVDEGMLQLRARIREVERAEGQTTSTTEGWMEWEKDYYESGDYDDDIVKAVGLLQRLLLDTRPSVVAGIVAAVVVTSGVAVSSLVVATVKMALGSS